MFSTCRQWFLLTSNVSMLTVKLLQENCYAFPLYSWFFWLLFSQDSGIGKIYISWNMLGKHFHMRKIYPSYSLTSSRAVRCWWWWIICSFFVIFVICIFLLYIFVKNIKPIKVRMCKEPLCVISPSFNNYQHMANLI